MSLEIIVAATENWAIGLDNKLIVSIPEDLARFKRITTGHTVLMGRKTWESLPEKVRPLPNRRNIVLSTHPNYIAHGAEVYSSVDHIPCTVDERIFVIGGGMLYRELLPYVDTIHLTRINGEWPGDTFFPEIDFTDWAMAEEPSGENKSVDYAFFTLNRVRKT